MRSYETKAFATLLPRLTNIDRSIFLMERTILSPLHSFQTEVCRRFMKTSSIGHKFCERETQNVFKKDI